MPGLTNLWLLDRPQDLCDEEGAEQRCEEYLAAAQTICPESPEVWSQLASLRLCQCQQDDAKKFTYKAVALCNKLEEDRKPSLDVGVHLTLCARSHSPKRHSLETHSHDLDDISIEI